MSASRKIYPLAASGAHHLPAGWRWTKLGEIAEFIMGQAPPGDQTNFEGRGAVFVKAGEFGTLHPITREWTTKPLKFAKAGDGLICVVGATSGKLNLAIDCAIGRSVAAIRPREETFDRFIHLQLIPKVLGLRAGSTGSAQGVISKDVLGEIDFALPPLDEQHRIAAEIEKQFTRLDAGVASLKRVQAALKRYRASVLKAACEGRLVPTEAELARQEGRSYEPATELLARILKERRARWESARLDKFRIAGKKTKDGNWKARYQEPAVSGDTTLRTGELPEGWISVEFRNVVLTPFREYYLPVIALNKETSREAVCLVFEKVNTGGVPLSVFELVTATYAADGFNLRDDWFGKPSVPGRHKKFASEPLLRDLEPTEFLQGISLLHTYERRLEDLAGGRSGKQATAVSAKREHVLAIPLSSYRKWADQLTNGFLEADRFLRMEGFRHPKFLLYRSQLIPLAAAMAHLGDRWREPLIYKKLARWYWCGVLGELYGGAIETRIGLDLQDILAWINQTSSTEPATIIAAGFHPSRLDTLRTRTSAAYRGIYVLLQRQGSKDFFWKARIVELDRDESGIDIHHIFPKAWCEARQIEPRVFNAIVNKTPISYKANRMIGGKAPSEYLEQIRGHRQVQMLVVEQDEILETHLADPQYLRADDFQAFYAARKQALIRIIEEAMGKTILPAAIESPGKDPEDEDDED